MSDQKNDFVGIAGEMPGTAGGFTMAAFSAEVVPVGAKLYVSPQCHNSSEYVSVSRGALQVAINMLRRDCAEQGRKVRGEIAEELARALI